MLTGKPLCFECFNLSCVNLCTGLCFLTYLTDILASSLRHAHNQLVRKDNGSSSITAFRSHRSACQALLTEVFVIADA